MKKGKLYKKDTDNMVCDFTNESMELHLSEDTKRNYVAEAKKNLEFGIRINLR